MKLTARVRANRANARRSTGPKTLGGKSAASRNALRHGLAIPVTVDPSLADEVERLARMIAGEVANSSRLNAPDVSPRRKSICCACVARDLCYSTTSERA